MIDRAATPAAPRRAGVVLAMLLVVYVFNFLDRQILGILAEPIKADLHLTDTQFGAIGGLAFAMLYSVLGLPLAYLADRTSRSGVIAASVAVWSAFTALCGTATGYLQLFLYRLGVGVGEAQHVVGLVDGRRRLDQYGPVDAVPGEDGFEMLWMEIATQGLQRIAGAHPVIVAACGCPEVLV